MDKLGHSENNYPLNGGGVYSPTHDAPSAKELSVLFQPVFEMDGDSFSPCGLDSLISFSKGCDERGGHRSPSSKDDRMCVAVALRAASTAPEELNLFISLYARTLDRDAGFVIKFKKELLKLGIRPERVVLYLIDFEPQLLCQQILISLRFLRRLGVAIVLDDFRAGNPRIQDLLGGRAEYIKIDRHWVNKCQQDPRKQALLRSSVVLASRSGSRIIATGVEHPEELRFLCESGIDLVQGDLLGRHDVLPALKLSPQTLQSVSSVATAPVRAAGRL